MPTLTALLAALSAWPTAHPYLYAHVVAPLLVGVVAPAAVAAVARAWATPPLALSRIVESLKAMGVDVPGLVRAWLASETAQLPRLAGRYPRRAPPRGVARVSILAALVAVALALIVGPLALGGCGPTSPANAVVDFPTRRVIEQVGCDVAAPAAAALDPGVLAILEAVCSVVLPRYGAHAPVRDAGGEQ